ncbi:pyridoxal phosphate-dependent transferase [Gorgonomyces haynaldii]|nr:pyridoxal phosphate-dependent transferase [Gorgonomyces haynaldii]
MSHFQSLTLAPPDPIFHLTASYKQDPFPQKVNLGVGAYRDDDGKPWVLPVAEHKIVSDPSLDHEYLPIDGLNSFTRASIQLMLGPVNLDKIASVQSISGTGAVRLGADFIAKFNKQPVYIPNPTWGNHKSIFADAGFNDIREYPYWNPKTRGLNFEGIVETLEKAPENSVILFHPCAHNPTGVDPTFEQWKILAELTKKKHFLVFFDSAYQGFASGNLDQDAQAVRYFVNQGLEVLIAQSYSKNFGLYNERCGCLSVVLVSEEKAKQAQSQLCKIVRASYSNPPAFGARIVSTVLNDPVLYQEWKQQLESMAQRIIQMRKQLFDRLVSLKTPGTWNHIVDQIGMFSFTGLEPGQVKVLTEKYHVYLTENGRISMAGLNSKNVDYFAEAIDWTVRNTGNAKF